MRHFASIAALYICTTVAAAQDINIDFGQPSSAPLATYGAAGQAGVWNGLPCYNYGPDDPLVDRFGNATTAVIHQSGGVGSISLSDPSVSGDDAALLDDAIVSYSKTVFTSVYLSGLENGTYEVLTYAWMPNHPEASTEVYYDNTVEHQLSGGAWTGSHQQGITYTRHIVVVGAGSMTGHVGLAPGGDPSVGGSVNGLQLRKLTCEGCAVYCSGESSGTACPCGNPGSTGRGCGNSASSRGALLATTGVPSISADTLVLRAESSVPFGPGLFFQGSTTAIPTAPFGIAFGNGLRCAGGSTPRLEVRTADDTGASSTTVAIHALGSCAAGDVRYYQLWYRDTPNFGSCTGGFNFSSAISLTWLP